MTKVNFGRVILGGLLAGLVLNVGDYLLHVPVLGDQWKSVMTSLGLPEPEPGKIVWFVVMDFILGISLVWLYAAIRPRFGAGPRTALAAGLAVWFFIWLWCFGSTMVMGLYPAKLVMLTILWGLFEVPIATISGAWLYKEA